MLSAVKQGQQTVNNDAASSNSIKRNLKIVYEPHYHSCFILIACNRYYNIFAFLYKCVGKFSSVTMVAFSFLSKFNIFCNRQIPLGLLAISDQFGVLMSK